MQTTAIRTVANSLPENKVILLTLLISKRYITYTDLRKKADSIPISRVKSHKKARGLPCGVSLAGALLWQLVWRAIAFSRTFSCLPAYFIRPSRRKTTASCQKVVLVVVICFSYNLFCNVKLNTHRLKLFISNILFQFWVQVYTFLWNRKNCGIPIFLISQLDSLIV